MSYINRTRHISNHARLAIVDSVDHSNGIAYIKWLDQTSDEGPRIPIPHPYAGPGGEGIFIGLRAGSVIAVDMVAYERYVPIGIVPLTGNYNDVSSADEASYDNIGYPRLEDGEIVIQGTTGSQLRFNNDGTIILQNEFNEGFVSNGEDASFRCAIHTQSPVNYTISQAGIHASGVIRRDVRIENGEEDFVNFLTNPFSEIILEEIGWDSSKQVTYISGDQIGSGSDKKDEKSFRNPAFVEDRQILFEFGREWLVGAYEEELNRLEKDDIPAYESGHRRERRSNVLSLSLTYPNELMEKVSGTLVDVFGNVLDINKNIIPPPEGKEKKELLDNIFEKLRHGVAYHMEINARKGLAYREGKTNTQKPILLPNPPNPMSTANNARDRSRWAFRIDKEGLTTINVPATSETGNVPLLARHETSSVLEIDEEGKLKDRARDKGESKEIYRNEENQDIFLDQFGPGGITISGNDVKNRLKGKKSSWKDYRNTQKKLGEFVEAGTAFHDITHTAINILLENINKKASDIFDDSEAYPDLPAISVEIDPQIPKINASTATRNPTTGLMEDQPNAGGRSVQANLDGSLEMSIGANTIDRVAFTLDTAGALVARLGRDRHGRSAIIQTDGSVVLEVGGWDFIGEDSNDQVDRRFVGGGIARGVTLPNDQYRFRDGKVVIRIRRANATNSGPDADGEDHLLILDETGISIESSGRLNIKSEMDLTIKSGGQLILDGEAVRIFEHNSRFVTKSGRRIV